MRIEWIGCVVVLCIGIIFSSSSRADDLHYKNILIGERASGMGGTFIAIADDPSGIYYNPAGIVFSAEDYFSLSANVYNTSKQTFKDIVPGKDYSFISAGLVPAFFGFTQAYGRHKWGFSVVVTNSDLMDQNDTLADLSTTVGKPGTLRRRFFRQDSSYLFGPGIGVEVGRNLAVGFTFFGLVRLDNEIDNQEIHYYPINDNKFLFRNQHLKKTTYGVLPKLGVQWMPLPQWSVGFTLSKLINVGGEAKVRQVGTTTDSSGTPVAQTGNMGNDVTIVEQTMPHELPDPVQISSGVAYFPSKKILFSFDFDYFTAQRESSYFPIQATTNWSSGMEWYVTEDSALRFGLYSNNCNTPEVSTSGQNQLPHVNLMGLTTAYSMVRPTSSFTLGISYAFGSGKGQAIGGSYSVQTVEENQMGFFLTGSYQL